MPLSSEENPNVADDRLHIISGFNYDDEVKQKIWWQYKESMRYDQLRDVVAKRKPWWEYLQEVLSVQGMILL
ncbi:hypothetical protein K1719_044898 [Acacia pycnantha]|nr:hypothetical protein K1719_044898 [Acacia pycnantha]